MEYVIFCIDESKNNEIVDFAFCSDLNDVWKKADNYVRQNPNYGFLFYKKV